MAESVRALYRTVSAPSRLPSVRPSFPHSLRPLVALWACHRYCGAFLFVVRCAAAVLDYARHALAQPRAKEPPHAVRAALCDGTEALALLLRTRARGIVRRWMEQASAASQGRDISLAQARESQADMTAEQRNAATVASARRRDEANRVVLAAAAHVVVLSAPAIAGGASFQRGEEGGAAASELLGSLAFLNAWCVPHLPKPPRWCCSPVLRCLNDLA